MFPVVSLGAVRPSPVYEGRDHTLTIQVRINPPLDGAAPDKCELRPGMEPCLDGGIWVYDSSKGEIVDELIAFVFRVGDDTRTLSYRVYDDEVYTPDRKIKVRINTHFDNTDTYGYMINESTITVNVIDNDSGADPDPDPDPDTNPNPNGHANANSYASTHTDAGTSFDSVYWKQWGGGAEFRPPILVRSHRSVRLGRAISGSYRNTDPDANADFHSSANADPHANANTDAHPSANADPHAETHGNAYSDTHGNPDADTHGNPDADTHAHSGADVHAYANGNRHSHANRDANPHGRADRRTVANPSRGDAADRCSHRTGGTGNLNNRRCHTQSPQRPWAGGRGQPSADDPRHHPCYRLTPGRRRLRLPDIAQALKPNVRSPTRRRPFTRHCPPPGPSPALVRA